MKFYNLAWFYKFYNLCSHLQSHTRMLGWVKASSQLGWSCRSGPVVIVSMLAQEIWKLDLIIQQWLNSESCLVFFRYTETQDCISVCPHLVGSSLWDSPNTAQSPAMEVENSSEAGDRAERQLAFMVLTAPPQFCSFPGWISHRLFYGPPASNKDIWAGIESQICLSSSRSSLPSGTQPPGHA